MHLLIVNQHGKKKRKRKTEVCITVLFKKYNSCSSYFIRTKLLVVNITDSHVASYETCYVSEQQQQQQQKCARINRLFKQD